MGSLVTAKCECGYNNNLMPLGHGMRDSGTTRFPYYCQNCNSLFLANVRNKEVACNSCNSKSVLSYEDNSIAKDDRVIFNWDDLELKGDKNLCPSCNEFSLEFICEGCWD